MKKVRTFICKNKRCEIVINGSPQKKFITMELDEKYPDITCSCGSRMKEVK